ncbi:hypothetical protein BKA64DRAFT_773436 [Cadophora sp. MPI-SDFR-AT-0126]|nr:hypothetical protein BKA64DRAFT_773436 [Leotiomycetes sp. MPI-SDFR-AT-0126]
MARKLPPRTTRTVSRALSKAITSINEDLERLHAEVSWIPRLKIQLSPTTAAGSPIAGLVNKAVSSPSNIEASPTIIILEKKKGLFRNPYLFQFEVWDDRMNPYEATPALGHGQLFIADTKWITKKSCYSRVPNNNMPQYKSKEESGNKVPVTGGSRLSFGDEIDTTRKKFNLLDPVAQVLLMQNQENYDKPLSSLVYLIRNLLIDKHSGAFEDECDMAVHDAERTLCKKEYVHQLAISTQGLLFDEEVQKRSENMYRQCLEEEEFWWGLEVYATWVITSHVLLEGPGVMKARGRAAVLTVRYLGLDDDTDYWKALEGIFGANFWALQEFTGTRDVL